MRTESSLRRPLPIDHAGYGVDDLPAAARLFRKLGFAPTQEKALMARDPESGESRPLGQLSSHVVFKKGYLELSAPAIENNHLVPLVERYSGLHILALATNDAEEQRRACQQRHPDLPAVAQASRPIEYGKHRGAAGFKWFPLPGGVFREGIVCFVEHLTRNLVFQDEVSSHPNQAVALAGVALFSTDPEATAARYKPFAATGQEIPHVHEKGYLRIITREDMANADFGLKIPAEDRIVGLDVETTSLAALKNLLRKNKMAFQERPEGVVVPLLPLNSFLLFKEQQAAF